MDALLREFEQLSLPSRVNWNDTVESGVERQLDTATLKDVLRGLVGLGNRATAFQWRKLREAVSIATRSSDGEHSRELAVQVYEEAAVFLLLQNELSECHIAMTRLLELYAQRKAYNSRFIPLIMLFRLHYCADLAVGIAQVSQMYRHSLPVSVREETTTRMALLQCRNVVLGNVFAVRRAAEGAVEMALESAPESSTETAPGAASMKHVLHLLLSDMHKRIASGMVHAYPSVSSHWLGTLLGCTELSGEAGQRMLVETYGVSPAKVSLNENQSRVVFNKRAL